MKTSSGNGRRLEHLLAARIFITIQIRIHRSSHTGIVVGVPNHFQRIGDRNLAISLQQGILIRRGDDPALNGFLRILKGQVRLDIADTHRQTQFERTGKFQPFGKIPAINGINLHQRFAVGRCSKKIFQNGNRIIERLEKMVVKYILSIIRRARLPEMEYRQGTIHIAGPVKSHNLQNISDSHHLAGNQSLIVGRFELKPCRHHLRKCNRKDSTAPIIRQNINEWIDTTLPMIGTCHVTGIMVCQQVPTCLIIIHRNRRFTRSGIHCIQLHGGDQCSRVDLLCGIRVGIEMLEIARTRYHCQQRSRNESQTNFGSI